MFPLMKKLDTFLLNLRQGSLISSLLLQFCFAVIVVKAVVMAMRLLGKEPTTSAVQASIL